MKGFFTDIEKETKANEYFRKVLYTASHSQLVIMSLRPGEDLGEEVHLLDQFIRCEQGMGEATLGGVVHAMHAGSAVLVPPGTLHNIINTSDTEPLKLYTVYAPPNHRAGVVHKTKTDAETDTEKYDGVTTESR